MLLYSLTLLLCFASKYPQGILDFFLVLSFNPAAFREVAEKHPQVEERLFAVMLRALYLAGGQ